MAEEYPQEKPRKGILEPKEAIKAEREISRAPASGIMTTRRRRTEYAPPLARGEDEEAGGLSPEDLRVEQEEQKLRTAARGKIPIVPGAVRLPLRFEGEFLAVTTGWEGWRYSDEDLEDIVELVQACGLEASPAIQLIACLSGVHAAKLAAFAAWKKKGVRKTAKGTPEEEASE